MLISVRAYAYGVGGPDTPVLVGCLCVVNFIFCVPAVTSTLAVISPVTVVSPVMFTSPSTFNFLHVIDSSESGAFTVNLWSLVL